MQDLHCLCPLPLVTTACVAEQHSLTLERGKVPILTMSSASTQKLFPYHRCIQLLLHLSVFLLVVREVNYSPSTTVAISRGGVAAEANI